MPACHATCRACRKPSTLAPSQPPPPPPPCVQNSRGELVPYVKEDQRIPPGAQAVAQVVWERVKVLMPCVNRLFESANPHPGELRIGGAPVHQFHMTLDGHVLPHRDDKDKLGSVIVWSHNGPPSAQRVLGGGFALYDIGLKLVPRAFTMLYVVSDEITHGSVEPEPGLAAKRAGVQRVGVAMVNKTGIMTRAHNTSAGPITERTWHSKRKAVPPSKPPSKRKAPSAKASKATS